mgnify:CR=1 FL=1
MIIALGYRVQSQVAVRFRRWATQRVNLLVSGFLDFAEFQALEMNPMTMKEALDKYKWIHINAPFYENLNYPSQGEHLEERQINILNNKQMSRSGSHRYETHTKTNYENNEYIYLMGYITSSFLPFFSVDEV